MTEEQQTGGPGRAERYDWASVIARMTVLWLIGAAVGVVYALLTGASIGNGIAGGLVVGSVASILMTALRDRGRS